MNKNLTKNMALSGMFLALGLLLPFVTGSNQALGNMILPMHIPVLLCGFICGPKYGAMVGFCTPLLRSAIWGMPPFPLIAVPMAFELLTYGLMSGLLYSRSKWQCIIALYRCLIAAMLCGRLVLAPVKFLVTSAAGGQYTLKMFIDAAFITAIPGIIIQLVLIPAIMLALDKTGLVKFRKAVKDPERA